MDAQASSISAAETGSIGLGSGASAPTSRHHGTRRDGAGTKKPSGNQQQWMAIQKGGGAASASRSDEEKAATASNGKGCQISSHTGGVTSAGSNSTTQCRKKMVRDSNGARGNDVKPNDTAVRSSSSGRNVVNSSGAIRIPGVRNVHSEAAERRFVPYLPQDDAAVAGFGEREGGVDASETQQAVDLLNEQLQKLLLLHSSQFWDTVNSDESLGVFMDSYLQYKRRWFDQPLSETTVGAIAGDGDLSKRVFMVLLRILSSEDSESSTVAGLGSEVLPSSKVLKKKTLFDIPKLMDIVAIYGYDNPELTRRLVGSVFQAQPELSEEFAAYIPPLLERMMMTYNRCLVTIEAFRSVGKSMAEDEAARVHGELLEVIDFLNDVAITLKAFVEAYPSAAKTLISSRSEQNTILLVMVNIYDTLVPNLLESVEASSNVSAARSPGLLQNLPNNLGDLAWKLLESRYIDRYSGDFVETAHKGKTDEDALQAGHDLFSNIVVLAGESARSGNIVNGNNHDSSIAHRTRKGGLLCNIERRHKLSSQILQAGEKGTVVLSEDVQNNLLKILSDVVSENSNIPSHSLPPTHQFPPGKKLVVEDVENETAIQQSRVSQVKDLFPELGDGYILACLEAYDDDPEKVIQCILEGTLHPALSALDTALATIPEKAPSQPPSKDKGKGKMIEQQPEVKEDKGPAVRERTSSLAHGTASASSLHSLADDTSSSATKATESSQRLSESNLPSQVVGRYLLRQRPQSGSFNEFLDKRHESQELRASIRAAVDQFAYEDEYDDSFDELNEYVADAGGNEEAESLADQVAGRGGEEPDRSGSGGLRRSSDIGRPVVLTPWGSETGKGRGRSSGPPPKATFESQKVVPVPEVQQGVSADQGLEPSSSHGRGGGRGGGRGKKKWKEQEPKPNFYLKEGKLYSYKVVGAVGVSSIEEADGMKREEEGLVHGLGAGGNVPLQPQQEHDVTGRAGKRDGSEEPSKPGQGKSSGDGEKQYRGQGDGGRGRGAANSGKDSSGRGSHGRRDDNHRRKDQAMKKHFQGVGGF